MHDIMLYPPLTPSPDGSPAYLIEHDPSFTSTLRTYFKRHKLRSKVKVGPSAEEELLVAAAWRNPADVGEGQSTPQELEEAERWLEERKKGWDTRVVGMGRRWIEEKDGEKRESCSWLRLTVSETVLLTLSLLSPCRTLRSRHSRALPAPPPHPCCP